MITLLLNAKEGILSQRRLISPTPLILDGEGFRTKADYVWTYTCHDCDTTVPPAHTWHAAQPFESCRFPTFKLSMVTQVNRLNLYAYASQLKRRLAADAA